MTIEFVVLSVILAGLFWLMTTLEEKYEETIEILKKIEKNTRPLPNGSYVESENEEKEEKTSGAGAFLGMLIGAMVGFSLRWNRNCSYSRWYYRRFNRRLDRV